MGNDANEDVAKGAAYQACCLFVAFFLCPFTGADVGGKGHVGFRVQGLQGLGSGFFQGLLELVLGAAASVGWRL